LLKYDLTIFVNLLKICINHYVQGLLYGLVSIIWQNCMKFDADRSYDIQLIFHPAQNSQNVHCWKVNIIFSLKHNNKIKNLSSKNNITYFRKKYKYMNIKRNSMFFFHFTTQKSFFEWKWTNNLRFFVVLLVTDRGGRMV
jgi:hypothetical protein